jgi:hypothetical protein
VYGVESSETGWRMKDFDLHWLSLLLPESYSLPHVTGSGLMYFELVKNEYDGSPTGGINKHH